MFGERLVVERRVELRLRQVRAERTADLHRADRPARGAAAAVVVENSRSVRPNACSIRPPRLMLPPSWIVSVPRDSPHAEVAVERAALLKNDRHARERHDVVDDRRLAEQALDRRQRRPRPDLAALALEALEHRGFLAADVRAGAEPDFEVEPFAAAADVLAEIAAAAYAAAIAASSARCACGYSKRR